METVESQAPVQPPEQVQPPVDRYAAVRQYSLAQILGVWAAAAVPMGVLAWIVAPWLRDRLGGRDPFAEALLICITVGLIWQFLLTLILVRRELGGLQWPRVRDALWLRAPRDPKTNRVGGRVWWWLIPFILVFAIEAALVIPGPSVRDFGDFLGSDRGEAFFSGAWGWFAVVVVLAVFNTVLGEELLFRGLLLPRMKKPSENGTGSATGRSSPSTTCTSRGLFPPPWWISSRLHTRRGDSRAHGWGSSCTRLKASSSSPSSSAWCSSSVVLVG